MESKKEKDLLIIERVLKGDTQAYGDIINHYSSRICSVCYGIVHNYEDAQDISQDVFIRAYKSLERFSGRSAFYTWLCSIAINASRDHLRKYSRVKKVELFEDHVSDKKGKQSSPAEDLKNKEVRKTIHSAINELPEEQKQVIILRELDDLSYNEIAKVLNCSEGTVMSRLHYARKKLQERLKDYR